MKNLWAVMIFLLMVSCGVMAETGEVWEYLHTQSELIYDGQGSWGENRFGYKMALRDSYWRADVYGSLSQKGGSSAALYAARADEAVAYLVTAMTQGGAGVFGFPAEPSNPEFGSIVSYMQDHHADMITNGWIVNLPTNDVQQLYYDHGYALYSVCRAYLRTGDTNLIPYIVQGADWILDKPLISNLNYLSALAKGLSLAYSITSNTNYLAKAVQYHTDVIIPGIDSSGLALDSHNQAMEYHAFIVSGFIAVRQQLTNGHPQMSSINTVMERMVDKMVERTSQEGTDWEQTWHGTNLQTWYELSLMRVLNTEEKEARDKVIEYMRWNLADYKNLSDYPYRKSLYANFFIGYFI